MTIDYNVLSWPLNPTTLRDDDDDDDDDDGDGDGDGDDDDDDGDDTVDIQVNCTDVAMHYSRDCNAAQTETGLGCQACSLSFVFKRFFHR